jgi:gluconate 2-dehydrogenase gamma chain
VIQEPSKRTANRFDDVLKSCAMISRRALLSALPAIAAAAQLSRSSGRFEFFTPEEARDADAIAEQIIPQDESPGAKQAGVVHFLDQAVSRYFPDQQNLYRKGLRELAGFASLSQEHQSQRLRSMEKTEFFEAIRTHTIMGFLADPKYGGNPGGVGWKLIGFSAEHIYRPPFGAYDGER